VHLFAVVVWFGGLMYQAAVTLPITHNSDGTISPVLRNLLRRFLPFIWMCVWTILVTGIGLLLFDPRYVFFRFDTEWSVLLTIKQMLFLIMIFFSYGYSRMFKRLDIALDGDSAHPDDAKIFFLRMNQFGRINVGLAIVVMLVAAGIR